MLLSDDEKERLDVALDHLEGTHAEEARLLREVLRVDCQAGFQPNWVSPPGDTIHRIMEEKGMSLEATAEVLQLLPELLTCLLNGSLVLSPQLAKLLADNLGGSERFWVNRETQYRRTLARLNLVSQG